jgi:predicted metal-dependent hydrolase
VTQLPLPLEARATAPTPAPAPAPTPAPATPAEPPPAPPLAAPAIAFVRRRGTRRYVLRVLDDGSLRVTVPWWGNQRDARAFVASQGEWVARQRARRTAAATGRWTAGGVVLVDGVPQRLTAAADGGLTLDGVPVTDAGADAPAVRAAVHARLRALARERLPAELLALAAAHGLAVTRVAIRNQASRWGSCSRRGAISLNWRLVQTPPFVREYVLLHELMHRRELNHSARFWRLVAAVCPRYLDARTWLRREGAQLFD